MSYLSLPSSDIQGIPLTNGDELLTLGIFEIGCAPKCKKTQVRRKRNLIGKLTRTKIPRRLRPDIKSYVIHWDKLSNYDPNISRVHHINASIRFNDVTEEMIETLIRQPQKPYEFIRYFEGESQENISRQLLIFDELIEERNPQKYLYLIQNIYGDHSRDGLVRGALAEFFALSQLRKYLSEGMNMFSNGSIKGLKGMYENGTEIDAIVTSYGKDGLETMLQELEDEMFIDVIRRT